MTNKEAVALVASDLKRRNLTPLHAKAVLVTVEKFRRHSPKWLLKVTRQDVRRFIASLSRTGVSACTQAKALSSLRTFYRSLVAHEVLRTDPTEELRVKFNSSPQPLLSEDAVRALLDASLSVGSCSMRTRPIALRDRACIELLYGVGIRRAELCAIKVVDLDFQRGTLLVRPVKRGVSRIVPLTPRTVARVQQYLVEGRYHYTRRGDSGFLFTTRTGTRLYPERIYEILRAASRRAGLNAHPHALRRALATHLVRAKVNEKVVQELFGHVSLSSTATYISFDREDLRRTVELLEHE